MKILERLFEWKLAQSVGVIRQAAVSSLLLHLSRRALKQEPVRIVAITGSVGKTTTKTCIGMLLGAHYSVRRTSASMNGPVSVPSTLLDIPLVFDLKGFFIASAVLFKRLVSGVPRVNFIVLELGAMLPDTLPTQMKFFTPEISVVTAIAPSHLATLGSIEGVFEEKSSIVSALPPSGHAVLCYDDLLVRKMGGLTAATKFFYGFSPSADVWLEEPLRVKNGLATTLHDKEGTVELSFPHIVSRYHLYAIMAAWCIGLICNIPRASMVEILQDYSPRKRRGTILDGPKNALIYDDSFNANPRSMEAALETFDSVAGARRRVLILGDMLELGGEAAHWHSLIGERAASVGDILIAVGRFADNYISGFKRKKHNGTVFGCVTANDAFAILGGQLKDGDAILVKGSHGSHVHELVERLQQNERGGGSQHV